MTMITRNQIKVKGIRNVWCSCRWLAALFVASLTCCGSQMHAQESINIGRLLRVDSVYAQKQEDSLYVYIGLSVKQNGIGRSQSLHVVPVLQGCDISLCQELAMVTFSGKSRYRYDSRNQLLGGAKIAMAGKEPSVRLRADNTLRTFAYQTVTVWQDWMENASLTVSQSLQDCCSSTPLADVLLADNLAIAGFSVSAVRDTTVQTSIPVVVDSVWSPNPAVYRCLPLLMVAEAGEKQLNINANLHITYRVGKSDILPELGNNRVELAKLDSLVSDLSNPLIKISNVSLTGYASIEGRAAFNEKLSQSRARSLAGYMQSIYGYIPSELYSIRGAGEDWEGLVALVADYAPFWKSSLLELMERYTINQGRETQLMKLDRGNVYRDMKKDLFPLLRRTQVAVSFKVLPATDEQARELITTRPELLSIKDIYRLAESLEPDSPQLIRIYETAVKTYPDDSVANNNMAAFFLRIGDAAAAAPYLDKAGDSAYAKLNRAVWHYLLDERNAALKMLEQAIRSAAGTSEESVIRQASRTLSEELVSSGKPDQIPEVK